MADIAIGSSHNGIVPNVYRNYILDKQFSCVTYLMNKWGGRWAAFTIKDKTSNTKTYVLLTQFNNLIQSIRDLPPTNQIQFAHFHLVVFAIEEQEGGETAYKVVGYQKTGPEVSFFIGLAKKKDDNTLEPKYGVSMPTNLIEKFLDSLRVMRPHLVQMQQLADQEEEQNDA